MLGQFSRGRKWYPEGRYRKPGHKESSNNRYLAFHSHDNSPAICVEGMEEIKHDRRCLLYRQMTASKLGKTLWANEKTTIAWAQGCDRVLRVVS